MKCQTEATLQSYADGELPDETRKAIAEHLFACAACSQLMSEIENDMMFLSATLEPAIATHVPTEHLRARLDAAIAAQIPETSPASLHATTHKETHPSTWLKSITAFFAPSWTASPRRVAAFASLAVALIIGIVLLFNESLRNAPQVAKTANKAAPVGGEAIDKDVSPQTDNTPSTAEAIASNSDNDHTRRSRRRIAPATAKLPGVTYVASTRVPSAAFSNTHRGSSVRADNFLPGEQSYLKAIASLSATIEASGDVALPPVRVEYKRNLAVVDEAIAATKREARRNPRDSDATEFVLAAYQSKLDLLDTIANAAR